MVPLVSAGYAASESARTTGVGAPLLRRVSMLIALLAPVLAFLIGTMVGTWIDHAAAAIPRHRPVRSLPACPSCDQPWRGIALAPVLGPLVARRCPECAAAITPLRPLTEVTTGLLFALLLWRAGLSAQFVGLAAFTVVLLVILRIDWQNHLIFQNTIVIGIVVALGYAAIGSPRPNALLWATVAAVSAATVFLFLYILGRILFRVRALGSGDILLAGLIGAMAGPETATAIFIGMFLSVFGGLAIVAYRVATKRAGSREGADYVADGPFLQAIRKRMRTDYIPYGAYLCAGTIITLLVR